MPPQALPMAHSYHGALPLPLELFLAFKDSIPLADLRAHVCFYQAHPRIAALYDAPENAGRFWQRACWKSGIGALPTDDVHDPQCWRNIAVEVVERDGFCEHPQCGEALLAYNRERIERIGEYVKPLAVLSVGQEPDARPSMHRALSQTTFCSKGGIFNLDKEAQLRPVGHGEQACSLLSQHSLIMRSFATDVPASALRINRIGGHAVRAGTIARPFGVTVHDVLAVIFAELDETLSTDALLHFLMAMFDRLPPDWPVCVASERLHTLRGLLEVSHLGEYVYDGSAGGDGPCFSIHLKSGR